MVDHIQYRDYLYDFDWLIKTFNIEINVVQGTQDKEISYPIIHKDGPITLQIIKERNGRLYLKLHGSLHKYFNYVTCGEEINYNDYTIQQIGWTIEYLTNKYKIKYHDSENQYLVGVEFGFNIETTFAPAKVVENNIILHKEDGPSTAPKHNRGGRTKTFLLTNYRLKYYAKNIEAGLPYPLLRVETKIRNKRTCRKYGINQLHDLSKRSVLGRLNVELQQQISHTTIIDQHSLAKTKATGKDKELFNTFISKGLLYEQRKGVSRVTRKTISRRRNQFLTLLEKYGLQKIKNEISHSAVIQFQKLSEVNGNHQYETIKNESVNSTKETETTLHIDSYCLPIPKRCPITGVDISHQNPDSKYLSVRTLKDMYYTDRKQFEEIRGKHQSTIGRKRTDLTDLCIHISHQIRDKDRPYKRRMFMYRNSLFPMCEINREIAKS